MCEILNILQGYDLHDLGFHAADAVHVMTEAFRLAYFDRNTYLGDPAFVHAPADRLLSKRLCRPPARTDDRQRDAVRQPRPGGTAARRRTGDNAFLGAR